MEEKVELVIADDIKIQNLIYNVRGKRSSFLMRYRNVRK